MQQETSEAQHNISAQRRCGGDSPAAI